MGGYLVPWWISAGSKTMWAIITGIFVGTALFGTLVYIHGKRMRTHWSRQRSLLILELKQQSYSLYGSLLSIV